MELYNCLLSRRSGRNYLDCALPEGSLHKILEAGLLAPSGRNLKTTEFITMVGREQLDSLAGVKAAGAGMLKNAAAAIVVIGDSQRSDTWIEDASIAMTNMMLRATDLGIANCWVQCRGRSSAQPGQTAADFLRSLLNLPEQYDVLAILSLGMADAPALPHTPEDADFAKVHAGKY